jgi:predicted dehydrogenase
MRAVIVGAGAAGLLHAMSYRAHGVAIAAVYDVDAGRARALAELVGARALAHLDDCVAERATFVSVTSPPSFHVSQAARFADGRRLVVVEKPVATTSEDLAILARLPGCYPVVQWRKGRAAVALRAAIARGELGPCPSVSIDLSLARDDAYFARGRSTLAGWGCGALLSIGIHAIDLAVHVLGERPVRVTGALGYGRGLEVETQAVTSLELASGALVSARISFDGGADDARFVVSGGGVTAELSGSEEDLTARPIAWRTGSARRLADLVALERSIAAPTAPPLVVPYLGDLVAQARLGGAEAIAAPTMADCFDAHLAILRVYEHARQERRHDGAPSCSLSA